MSVKEIKDDLNKWVDRLRLWVKRHDLVKMSGLPVFIYRYNIIPNQTAENFL